MLATSTDWLVIREFVADDWAAVLCYQRDPRYLRLYPWSDRTEAEVREFIQKFIDQQRKRPRCKFQLVITLKDDGQVIGNCGIRRKPENDWEADIGLESAPEHWGCGYATEAAEAMVYFGFSELGLHPRGPWRRWDCDPKAVCVSVNTSKGAVGIRCYTEHSRVNGELPPGILDPPALMTANFPRWSIPYFANSRRTKDEGFESLTRSIHESGLIHHLIPPGNL